MKRVGVIVLSLLLAVSCASEPAAEPDVKSTAVPVEQPEPAGDPSNPQPTSNIVVSDAVPTLEELEDMGIGPRAAECFIATIDPDDTGRVASAELFVEAFGACL